MEKRAFIIHGRDRYPERGWLFWLKNELQSGGFQAFLPLLPDPKHPRVDQWISKIAETVGQVDEQTYFIGHSLGCRAIAKYLESLPGDIRAGGAVFVAGFFGQPKNLENDPETQRIAEHWLENPVGLEKARRHLGKSIAIFSDNDPHVPLESQDDFKDKLGSEIIVMHDMGHFSVKDGVLKLPVALESVLKIAE